ncbi:MAG: hypothetical protein LBS52_10440 [Dysgonamonadaceae bacterium]|nr:hypothetical protein [Dysgonamonadaceae bacterium]
MQGVAAAYGRHSPPNSTPKWVVLPTLIVQPASGLGRKGDILSAGCASLTYGYSNVVPQGQNRTSKRPPPPNIFLSHKNPQNPI